MAECKEPWETTTQYGPVDLTLHPVLRECYRVACLIERCGASEDLTRASSAAFDLCGKVQDVILGLCGAGIDADKKIERLQKELRAVATSRPAGVQTSAERVADGSEALEAGTAHRPRIDYREQVAQEAIADGRPDLAHEIRFGAPISGSPDSAGASPDGS